MEKKNYSHPVTKTLSLGKVCSEPIPSSQVPVYAAPDIEEVKVF